MVLTSHDRLGESGKKTGFWLEELAAPYYVLRDAGVELTLASPAGGQPPLDPKSNEPDAQTDDTRRLDGDAEAKRDLANTHVLAEVRAEDFDALFVPGGHGPLWDLAHDRHLIALIERLLARGKPVAAVCHGPIALVEARTPSGDYVVRGKRVTAFTNAEEHAVELDSVVPERVEDRLKERGAHFENAGSFEPFVVHDGLLVTGQNPASSAQTARELLRLMRS